MDLLSRREHSYKELFDKLRLRNFEADDISSALDKLLSENLLNDERFTESYVHYREQKVMFIIGCKKALVHCALKMSYQKKALMVNWFRARWRFMIPSGLN